jgi:hypothetical protein
VACSLLYINCPSRKMVEVWLDAPHIEITGCKALRSYSGRQVTGDYRSWADGFLTADQ